MSSSLLTARRGPNYLVAHPLKVVRDSLGRETGAADMEKQKAMKKSRPLIRAQGFRALRLSAFRLVRIYSTDDAEGTLDCSNRLHCRSC